MLIYYGGCTNKETSPYIYIYIYIKKHSPNGSGSNVLEGTNKGHPSNKE